MITLTYLIVRGSASEALRQKSFFFYFKTLWYFTKKILLKKAEIGVVNGSPCMSKRLSR